jgi:signal transduction histidine kinase
MNSIGARLALWYAAASSVTLAVLFLAGYFLLEKHLVHGLDLMEAAEFEQIKAHLGPDYEQLDSVTIDKRIRETIDVSSVLFYIDIHRRKSGAIFYSSNLHGAPIPDLPGLQYNVTMRGVGEVRVNEFIAEPFEIMIATSLIQVRKVMEGYVEVSLALLAVAVVASAGIGYWLSRLALRPVRVIQETAIHIGSDNLSERIPVGAVEDEISNLARLLNEMFDRLESAFNQTRRFTAEASHELKTPLSLVRLQAEKLMVEGGLTAVQEEALHMQLEEITRLNKIIEELLFLSRAEARAITLGLKKQDPRPFFQNFAQDARVLVEDRGVRFVESFEGEGCVDLDPKWIRQVLFNLVANALNVSPPNGLITLSASLSGGRWRVSVEDEGPGVPAEQRERIFERFVRLESGGRQNDAGSGLGLAIARSIVGLHRGTIRAEAPPGGRGLCVVFELPASAAAPGAKVVETAEPAGATRREDARG